MPRVRPEPVDAKGSRIEIVKAADVFFDALRQLRPPRVFDVFEYIWPKWTGHTWEVRIRLQSSDQSSWDVVLLEIFQSGTWDLRLLTRQGGYDGRVQGKVPHGKRGINGGAATLANLPAKIEERIMKHLTKAFDAYQKSKRV